MVTVSSRAWSVPSVIVFALSALMPVFAQEWTTIPALENIPAAASLPTVRGSYIVMMKQDAGSLDNLVKEHGIAVPSLFAHVQGFSAQLSDTQVAALKQDARVAIVEQDQVVQMFSHLSTPSQTLPTGIRRIRADESPTALIDGRTENVDVDVAVIDTGIDLDHKDLNVVRNVNTIRSRSGDDDNGHGTHVAGTIGARDNGIGVVGVAPGARLWAVKVLDRNGSGYMSDIIEGVDFVTQNASQIEVANMSLGCRCASAALDEAITRSVNAGVVYVVAAGNSAADASGFTPANHQKVITVSAIADFNGLPGGGAKATCRSDVDDSFADFSNYGAPVDIAAPGVCINSTWRDNKYSSISGTSMASPHVAGAAALYIAANGKPIDASGVESVKQGLMNQATAQSDGAGFSGDPDGLKEPLLNVISL